VLDTPQARTMAALFGVNTTAVVDGLSSDLAGALIKSTSFSPTLRCLEARADVTAQYMSTGRLAAGPAARTARMMPSAAAKCCALCPLAGIAASDTPAKTFAAMVPVVLTSLTKCAWLALRCAHAGCAACIVAA
jgi:hypothetical protein